MRSTNIKTPALVIMLGTTPALAGLELCRQMLSLDDDDRRSISLVHIDTDDVPPTVAEFYREHEGKFARFSARVSVPVGINHADDPAVGTYEELSPDQVAYVRWHTYIRNKTPQYFDTGAGGIRNNGHVALCFHRDRILGRLEEALNSLEGLSPSQGERAVSELQVYIVSFLGGGTGSGMLADIAVMVRRMIERRQYGQRLTLYCILPGDHIAGATLNEMNWRKSNATATLLEIMAHGLAAGTQDGFYSKYLLDTLYRIRNGPIANEVLLTGKTNMRNLDETAAIVGLDLYQRITDASGVGAKETSSAPDRRQLGDQDDMGLPTVFGTSCPFEVRFPAEETAQAFAEYSASFLLDKLLGSEPRVGDTSGNTSTWRAKWSHAAEQNNLPSFGIERFSNASRARLDANWEQLGQHQRTIATTLHQDIEDVRAREERTILGGRQQSVLEQMMTPVAGNDLSNPIARKIIHLRLLLLEYGEAMALLKEQSAAQGEVARPRELERKLMQGVPYLPVPVPWVNNAWDDRFAQLVWKKYNAIIRRYYRFERRKALEALLIDLIAQVEALLREEKGWYEGVKLDKSKAELRTHSLERTVWSGALERAHAHYRHVFDLASFECEQFEGNSSAKIAVKGLYLWATRGARDSYLTTAGTFDMQRDAALADLQDRLRDRWRADLGVESAGDTDGLTVDELQAIRASSVASTVVNALHDDYLEIFRAHNLFDILQVGIAANTNRPMRLARQRIPDYLRQHLDNIKNLIRDLVVNEPELWLAGPKSLLTTFILGINTQATRDDRRLLEDALRQVGAMARRAESPEVRDEQDPHRLKINYSQHGISIRTLPEYYRRYDDSSMQHFWDNEMRWYGDGNPDAGGSYGANRMPVHSSSEMERLVWTRGALGGHKLSLVERVIRPDHPGNGGPRGGGGGGGGDGGGGGGRSSGPYPEHPAGPPRRQPGPSGSRPDADGPFQRPDANRQTPRGPYDSYSGGPPYREM